MQYASFTTGTVVTNAAGAAEVGVTVPFRCRIVGVSIVDFDGIAADNTDYVDSDVTGTTGYDSRAANQGALTADTSIALTVDPANAIVAAGGNLKFVVAKGGSGKATEAAVTWFVQPIN
jgi:hypothetical protein